MSPAGRAALRAVVIAAGAAVALAGLLAFRAADWPIYLVFILVSAVLFLPYVEVLPDVPMPVPEMAATIGFLYVGGLPIIVLSHIAPLLVHALRWLLPDRLTKRIPELRAQTPAARRRLGMALWSRDPDASAGWLADVAMSTLGLGARWAIVAPLSAGAPPTANLGAVALAEMGGYVTWGALSLLPIYPDRPFVTLSSAGRARAALIDINLIIVLALTPFVFLICYGYQAHGLPGAAAWALSALGVHFTLKRLNERRLKVEEQNRRLAALNRELEHSERLSAIGKMSSVVSHQILQQLGVIGLYADLIRSAADDATGAQPDVRNYAAAIEDALHDVNRVMTDLLVFGKDLRLNIYEHPLAAVITECLDDCRAAAAAHAVQLRLEPLTDCRLSIDKLKIKQALGNLLRNAIEASPPGETVTVSAAGADGGVEIAVSDRGPGVPAADRQAMFTPFFTTKEHGTGLGLAIARQFVEAHGGRLTLRDDNGAGATLVVWLPLRAPLPERPA